MDLADLVAARGRCWPRPSWVALFAKAFALAARGYPSLRQSFLQFPWDRLYEHPHHVAAVNVEREVDGEPIVLFCLIRNPQNRSLAEIEEIIRHHKEAPLEQLRSHRRAMAVSKIPRPFRRWFWWAALNVFGRRRCHNYGTFSTTSVCSQGAGVVYVVPVLTSSLHYNMFDEKSRVDVRLTWDHRVMDGGTTARFLTDLDHVLHTEILHELQSMQAARAA
jgi:pyruvate/2-oxoglutarate dehydrogenase complex dihydrolipoamide acyltransferase (E2) component